MNAYVYQAALWCEDCAGEIKRHLLHTGKAPDHPEDETSYDSDDYPKGPYPDGGGEADTPQHCDGCRTFLENTLTTDGVKYTLEYLLEYTAGDGGNTDALDDWADHLYWYGLEGDDLATLDGYWELRLEEMASE